MTTILVPGRYGPQAVNSIGDIYLSGAFRLYGEYGEHEIALLRSLLKPGDTVLDIGANLGALTLPLAKHVGPTGKVLAFEPQPRAYRRLVATLELNNCANAWAINHAVGATPGVAQIPVPDEFTHGNHGGLALGGDGPSAPVQVDTIDALGLDALTLLKADVEGMELDVLQGAEATIDRLHPMLYVESDRMEKREALIRWLQGKGYQCWFHCPTLFNPANHFGNPRNAYQDEHGAQIASFNVLAVHGEHEVPPPDYLGKDIPIGVQLRAMGKTLLADEAEDALLRVYPWLELPATPRWNWELVRRHWVSGDPYQIEPDTPEYYRVKYAVAECVKPRSILEIGVRAGYSAAAFLQAGHTTHFTGLDLNAGTWGGVKDYQAHAQKALAKYEGVTVDLQFGDSQQLDRLPGGPYDLVHVDGDHSRAGAMHDVTLALDSGAKWVLVDDYDFIPPVAYGTNAAIRGRHVRAWHVWDGGYRGNLLIENLEATATRE